MLKKIVGWFGKAWPTAKTLGVTAGAAALTAAGSGYFGPKGAVVAGAVSSVIALFAHKPGSEPE